MGPKPPVGSCPLPCIHPVLPPDSSGYVLCSWQLSHGPKHGVGPSTISGPWHVWTLLHLRWWWDMCVGKLCSE